MIIVCYHVRGVVFDAYRTIAQIEDIIESAVDKLERDKIRSFAIIEEKEAILLKGPELQPDVDVVVGLQLW